MIVADILGPWHDVEATATDPETGETYTIRDQRRLPQLIHDAGIASWRDVTAQASERIPPEPPRGVWRVWCSEAQLAKLMDLPQYLVLRSAEVERQHQDGAAWPERAAEPGQGDAAFPELPNVGWLKASAVYQRAEQVLAVRQSHDRAAGEIVDLAELFAVYPEDALKPVKPVEPIKPDSGRIGSGG